MNVTFTTDFKDQFRYYKTSDSIVVELSDIEDAITPPRDDITIISKSTKKSVKYVFTNCDYDASHEDIIGYCYRSVDKNVKTSLVVIND